MNEIIELTKINFSSVFIAVFVIFIGVKAVVSIFEWFIDKLGLETKWMRKRREEHELLIQTSQNLATLQEKHNHDVEESDAHDENIKKELSTFIYEIKTSILETQREIKQFAENRIHDRKQSIQIQKELTDSIKSVSDSEKERGKQIEALMRGSKELLGAEIDKRYREYISLDGIPESEVDEFNDIFAAYKGLNGNHSRDAKYNYVKNHLRVIPVETKLINNKESE